MARRDPQQPQVDGYLRPLPPSPAQGLNLTLTSVGTNKPTGVTDAKIRRQPRIVKRVRKAGRGKARPCNIRSRPWKGSVQADLEKELQRCIIDVLTKSDRVSRHQNKLRLERERNRTRGLRGGTRVFNFRL